MHLARRHFRAHRRRLLLRTHHGHQHALQDISPPYYGNLTETQDDLNAWAERVHRAGIRLNCHANGDVAIDRVLTAYERALKLYPRADARPKITHCSLINDTLIARMKAMDAVPAEFSTYAYYNADKFHFYGEDIMKHMTAFAP